MITQRVFWIVLIIEGTVVLSQADNLEILEKSLDWCAQRLECSRKNKLFTKVVIVVNTACKYSNSKPGLNCKNVENTQTFEKRTQILGLHNDVRMRFAQGEVEGWPPATNMRMLRWDFELEYVANIWAMQCLPQHDICRITPKHRTVGQNMAVRSYNSTKYNEDLLGQVNEPMNDWVNEQLYEADPKNVQSYRHNGRTRFLTQIIWADTNRLGCAEVSFIDLKDWYSRTWICNYAPAGNIPNAKIYKIGPTCSNCPPNAECLCKEGESIGKGVLSRKHSSSQRSVSSFFTIHVLNFIVILINLQPAES